jgi:hypothetical protein
LPPKCRGGGPACRKPAAAVAPLFRWPLESDGADSFGGLGRRFDDHEVGSVRRCWEDPGRSRTRCEAEAATRLGERGAVAESLLRLWDL